ncbi:MAG: imelysin family protein [Rhodobacteraceae bacterium]|jgi:hypothetical protein|nr:imelysin family protein [Paracoccaceae bacterium]
MRPLILSFCLAVLPLSGTAQSQPEVVARVVDQHVLPGFAALESETAVLADLAIRDCNPFSSALRRAYGTAFDAWIRVSHLAFGPLEDENRLFALSFWPDERGMTPRSLERLILANDFAVESQQEFATVSVAARGFYALEFLLYDQRIISTGSDEYRCALVQAVTRDIHQTAQELDLAWRTGFADLMRNAGDNDRFHSADEALRTLLGGLNHGLEYTIDLRLGRPLGTFEAPRPLTAEARRSGRSLRHVLLALQSLDQMTALMAPDKDGVAERLAALFASAITRAQLLDDPVFVSVTEPEGHLRIEDLQRRVSDIHDAVQADLIPALGVGAGFNALDGD